MELEPIRANIAAALMEPAVGDLTSALQAGGWTPDAARDAIRLSVAGRSLEPLHQLVERARAQGVEAAPGAIERLCLLHAISRALDRLPSVPVTPSIERFLLKELQFVVQPDAATKRFLENGGSALLTLAKITMGTRFPAGCFHCEFSGIPRAFLPKSPVRDWPRLAAMILRVKGFKPCFEVHMNPRLRLLREEDGMKAYHRIAKLMELYPEVKAMVAFSWLRSPDNHRTSPHLRWINEVVVKNGGFETTIGEVAVNSGVLASSESRQRLFKEGSFKPTAGMVIWPRDAVIRWAGAYSSEPL